MAKPTIVAIPPSALISLLKLFKKISLRLAYRFCYTVYIAHFYIGKNLNSNRLYCRLIVQEVILKSLSVINSALCLGLLDTTTCRILYSYVAIL